MVASPSLAGALTALTLKSTMHRSQLPVPAPVQHADGTPAAVHAAPLKEIPPPGGPSVTVAAGVKVYSLGSAVGLLARITEIVKLTPEQDVSQVPVPAPVQQANGVPAPVHEVFERPVPDPASPALTTSKTWS